MTRPTS